VVVLQSFSQNSDDQEITQRSG